MKGKHTMIVPPNYIGMMTGTLWARVQGNRVCLVYRDGTEEEATLKTVPEDYFALVGETQRAARKLAQ